jgi:purine-nucleoside phosphorylase
MTNDLYERVEAAAAAIRSQCQTLPQTAVVLGSGLGDFADTLLDAVRMPYAELPHWPASNVVGHAGRLVVGSVAGRPIAVLAGRAHFYEGHDLSTVVFATRVMGRLGVREIDDHINLLGSNPLLGFNDERFGPRFPDMTEVYSRRLRTIADAAAGARGIPVSHGVYVVVHGPSYETPAEIRFLRTIGADAVGMSTVPEALAARHMGIEVLGLSCITNMAAGVLPQPLNHEEVLETARHVRGAFIGLLEGIIERL